MNLPNPMPQSASAYSEEDQAAMQRIIDEDAGETMRQLHEANRRIQNRNPVLLGSVGSVDGQQLTVEG